MENMHDVPYMRAAQAGPEQVAFMARVCTEVKKLLPSMPCGVQVLAGNNMGALAVAAAAGDCFPSSRRIDVPFLFLSPIGYLPL